MNRPPSEGAKSYATLETSFGVHSCEGGLQKTKRDIVRTAEHSGNLEQDSQTCAKHLERVKKGAWPERLWRLTENTQ